MFYTALSALICSFMVLWGLGSILLDWTEHRSEACLDKGQLRARVGIGMNRDSTRRVEDSPTMYRERARHTITSNSASRENSREPVLVATGQSRVSCEVLPHTLVYRSLGQLAPLLPNSLSAQQSKP